MLTPRELEVLDVVGEVMQERLQEVRKEYEAKLSDLQTKVAALEARPEPDVTSQMVKVSNLAADALTANMDEVSNLAADALNDRIVALETRPLPDVAPLTDKIAALETRAPEVTLETMRKMGDDLEEVIERRFAMLPPPPDLTPLNEKFDLLQARGIESHDHLVEAIDQAAVKTQERLEALDARAMQRLLPADIEPLAEKIAELETRPTGEEVLKLAQSALTSTRASLLEALQVQVIDLFKALPIPEKGEQGEPGINGTSVTAEQFRDLFEASYAKFELDTERRILDLVQRTLDRVPIPQDGKDGLGFDDMNVVQTGDRTIEVRFERGEQKKVFGFKFPWLIDRGVWKTGTVYEKGDVVTWGGSSWIVECDNPSGKPKDGVSPDWRLMAKAGRDGKNGVGLKGDPGPPGKPGRDLTNGMLRGPQP